MTFHDDNQERLNVVQNLVTECRYCLIKFISFTPERYTAWRLSTVRTFIF